MMPYIATTKTPTEDSNDFKGCQHIHNINMVYSGTCMVELGWNNQEA